MISDDTAIGTRVRYITENPNIKFAGTVTEVDPDDEAEKFLVEWDNNQQAWYSAEQLEVVE